MRLLLEKGTDANATHKDGWTALHRAAESGREVTVRLLLENGADANAKHCGWTALHWTAGRGHEATVDNNLSTDTSSNSLLARRRDLCLSWRLCRWSL